MNAHGEHTRSLWMKVEVDPEAPQFSGKQSCDTVDRRIRNCGALSRL